MDTCTEFLPDDIELFSTLLFQKFFNGLDKTSVIQVLNNLCFGASEKEEDGDSCLDVLFSRIAYVARVFSGDDGLVFFQFDVDQAKFYVMDSDARVNARKNDFFIFLNFRKMELLKQ